MRRDVEEGARLYFDRTLTGLIFIPLVITFILLLPFYLLGLFLDWIDTRARS